ncbi:hypothetical protein H0H92_010477 [Tricholoma furcatifolium]|nr:hypothetical protein H0H92_010477 [Tricholoma furcatifolium]
MAFSTCTVLTSFILSFLFDSVQAAPLRSRQAITTTFTTLTTPQISAFKSFTLYASTAYCQPDQTLAWSCGASGGDGDDVQFWFVGIDSTLQTVIVSHQGTDPSKLSVSYYKQYADFFLGELDPTLFYGIDTDIQVHDGFRDAHAETAEHVLSAVQAALAQSGLSNVTVVGHSLGAAIALLDGVYLPLQLPGVNVNVIGYGMPRVGNQAFANYVDANVLVTHVTNKSESSY